LTTEILIGEIFMKAGQVSVRYECLGCKEIIKLTFSNGEYKLPEKQFCGTTGNIEIIEIQARPS
jgi:hypothetical protein